MSFQFRDMQEYDLMSVMSIELAAYTHPWQLEIVCDCLRSNYISRVITEYGVIQGYSFVSVGAGEAHLLNLTICPQAHGQGLGRRLLEHMLEQATLFGATICFLEVRVSNQAARHLYESVGFHEIAKRYAYYPTDTKQREDAIVMAKEYYSFEHP